MKLFVSVLVLAASTAAAPTALRAQEYVPPQNSAQSGVGVVRIEPVPGGQASPQQLEQLKALALTQKEAESLLSNSQAGCPLMMTRAHLNWPASYLPVTSADRVTEPNLALSFQNLSGKPIRSVSVTARILAKRNIYDLDAAAFDLRLTFSGVDAADKAAEQLREIRLPAKMYAYGVTRVSLEQVMFADGSFWMTSPRNNCSLDVRGSGERVEAK